MAGSIRPKHKGWELTVSQGVDPVTGRRRRVTRFVKGSRREAEKLLAKLVVEVGAGDHAGGSRTVGDLLEMWLDQAARRLSPKTLHDYRMTVDQVLMPELGLVKLDKLRAERLDRLYGQLLVAGPTGRPLSNASVRKVHAMIRAALTQGMKWGWINRNVATLATPPGVQHREIVPPDAATVMLLIDTARTRGDVDLAEFIALAAVIGARRGEMCALKWDDVDAAAGVLHIRRAVVQIENEVILKDTKTHQGRRVALADESVDLFTTRRSRCEARAQSCGVELGDWLFSDSLAHDSPAMPEQMTRRFSRLTVRLGVKVRLHDLRHFAATQALDAGIALPTVSKRLGHRDTTTTANIYAHAVNASDREAAGVLARLIPNEASVS